MPLNILTGAGPRFENSVFVTRPLVPGDEEFAAAAAGIFRSRRLTNGGPHSESLEQRLRARFDGGDCAVTSSGTTALLLALHALGLTTGEVITTPFTFPATVHVIRAAGLDAVFCDIDPGTFNVTAEAMERVVGPRTRALLPVHTFGVPCDLDAIEDLATRHGLSVVYDAAAAFDVRVGGRCVCARGDASALSFHATKLYNTCEGGAVVSPRADIVQAVRLLRNFGIVSAAEVGGFGLNGKLTELQSAYGVLVLPRVDQEIQARQSVYRRYVNRLSSVPGLGFQRVPAEARWNFHSTVLLVDPATFGINRDQLATVLEAENVFPRKYFSPLCSQVSGYSHLPSASLENLPTAHDVASRVLCLPTYGDLALDAVDTIADIITLARTE